MSCSLEPFDFDEHSQLYDFIRLQKSEFTGGKTIVISPEHEVPKISCLDLSMSIVNIQLSQF